MFQQNDDRGPPAGLRGWLSDVYLPSLLDPAGLVAVGLRLGSRATIDDPLFGRATGQPSVDEHLARQSEWLLQHQASYERVRFTTGVDRDVTEGTLELTFGKRQAKLPVAVVAERRKSREVELRVYYTTEPIRGAFNVRLPLLDKLDEVVLPGVLGDALAALRSGNLDAFLAVFESESAIRDSRGFSYGKATGNMEDFFRRATRGGLTMHIGGAAEDGWCTAVEYTLQAQGAQKVTPQPGLMVFERGESGLLRMARLYDDINFEG